MKRGVVTDLLDSETNAGLVNKDSHFSVLRANREVFQQE